MNGYATLGGGPRMMITYHNANHRSASMYPQGSNEGSYAHGGYEMNNQPRQRGLSRRPIRRPELVAEGEGNTFLSEFLVDARLGEGHG